jgi:hypothetical protein
MVYLTKYTYLSSTTLIKMTNGYTKIEHNQVLQHLVKMANDF